MAKEQVARRWQKRFGECVENIDELFGEALQSGEVEAVHALRVALRRARLLALAGRPALGRESADDFRHWAYQVMELLGRVRDADITLDWLVRHKASRAMIGRIRSRRTRLWRAAAPELKAMRSLPPAEIHHGRLNKDGAKRLEQRFLRTLERFHTLLVTEAKRFEHLDVDSLHEFRRNLRRWRYLNETLMSRREQRTNRRLARVITLQDALGEMQNCEVIRLFLRPLTLPRAELQSLDQKLARQQRAWLAKAGGRLGAVGRIRV